MCNKDIKVLLIEDNIEDVVLIKESLRTAKNNRFVLKSTECLADGLEKLRNDETDIVLLDLSLPDSFGLDTLSQFMKNKPTVPVIILTGTNDEDIAVEAVHKGAQDYLVKGESTKNMLIRSIKYAIERHKLILKLQEAFDKIRTLSGLLPICSYCKKVRDDKGYWNQIETYIKNHADVNFSHSICPECFKSHYPEVYEEIDESDLEEEI